jgi:hypothetical protein
MHQLVPAAYVGISLIVLLAVVPALFSPRLDLPARPACALVLIPHTGEAIGNLTNLQWVCGLGLVWLLLARDASTMRQHVTDGIIALVFGLTGTFSILFAPLFTWRAWRRRTAASLVLAVLVVITAGVQLWTIAHSPPHPSGQENLTVERWRGGWASACRRRCSCRATGRAGATRRARSVGVLTVPLARDRVPAWQAPRAPCCSWPRSPR